MELNELEIKKATLNGEISLLEKEKAKVQGELNQLQKLHGEELAQKKKEIDLKTAELKQLTDECRRLQTLSHIFAQSYLELKKKMGELRESEVAKANAESTDILAKASAEKGKWEVASSKLKTDQDQLKKDQDALEEEDQAVSEQKDKNERKEKELKTQAEETKTFMEAKQAELVIAEEKRDDLERQIKSKALTLKGIDITIDIKKKFSETISTEAEKKVQEATSILNKAEAKRKFQDERELKLQTRETKVKDDEARIRRRHGEAQINGN